jgi:flavin-dependent dehydrogenase
LSGKVVNIMKRMPDDIFEDFITSVKKVPSYGIRFTAPNLHCIDVPFSLKPENQSVPPGFVCKRADFDDFLYRKLINYNNIRVITGEHLIEVKRYPDRIQLKTRTTEYSAKMVAGADGVHSIVRKDLYAPVVGKNHFCLGIRGYFQHVAPMHPNNFIELIFLKSLLPGYFWIFPSTDGMVNAGFGMMQDQVVERRENLTVIFNDLIRNHPLLSARFKNASLVGKLEAHTLPMGSFQFERTGERSLLLGDAAFLVDPFSGEGIGNAMASGEIASSIIHDCFLKNSYSRESLASYDVRLQKRFGQEFRTTTIMQKLARHPWLINLVVNKANRNIDLKELLTAMFTNEEIMKKLTRPGFYAGLLFR